MFSPVASGIFAFRNVGKAENGEIGRAPVAVGQFAGIVKEIGKYDKTIALGTKNALQILQDVAGDSKALKYAGKTVDFLSSHVNPLICVSSGIKVAMSDDKERTLKEEAGSLAFMFAGETLISKNYDKIAKSRTVTNTIDKMSKSSLFKPMFKTIAKHNWGGKIGAIIKGLSFVTVSIGSSCIGLDITKSLLKTTDKNGKECLVS